MNLKNKDNNLLVLILLLIALEAFLFFSGNAKIKKEERIEQEKIAHIESLFVETPILAKGVAVYNATLKKEIFNKNGGKSLPIASLAKIMTVWVALNEQNFENEIKISPNSIKENGDSGLHIGERWQIGDLAKLTLAMSANDGAQALSKNEKEFLNKMNIKTEALGLKNTIFFNTTGLDIDENVAGAYSSAFEVNQMALSAFLAYPEIFGATTAPEINLKSISGFEHKIKNTNTLIGKIPNLLFSKTGLTTLAGGNLTVIFKNQTGELVAITVLGSTTEGRFSDMEKLVKISYNLNNASPN